MRDATVYWADARDESKNVLVPVGALAEQALACGPGGSACTWTLRTKRTEYVFREEAGAGPGASARSKLEAAFAALLALRPGLPSTRTGGGA